MAIYMEDFNEKRKIKFKDRLKDISSGLGDSLKESTLWGSIFRPGSPFRKGYSDSPRNRSYVVMNNVLYHLHPVKVKRHGVRLSYTLCLGGLSFFTIYCFDHNWYLVDCFILDLLKWRMLISNLCRQVLRLDL